MYFSSENRLGYRFAMYGKDGRYRNHSLVENTRPVIASPVLIRKFLLPNIHCKSVIIKRVSDKKCPFERWKKAPNMAPQPSHHRQECCCYQSQLNCNLFGLREITKKSQLLYPSEIFVQSSYPARKGSILVLLRRPSDTGVHFSAQSLKHFWQ